MQINCVQLLQNCNSQTISWICFFYDRRECYCKLIEFTNSTSFSCRTISEKNKLYKPTAITAVSVLETKQYIWISIDKIDNRNAPTNGHVINVLCWHWYLNENVVEICEIVTPDSLIVKTHICCEFSPKNPPS